MASQLQSTVFLLELLLVLSLYLSCSTSTATPLDDICNRVSDRAFCYKDYGSNPKTKTPSLYVLAQIAIDEAGFEGGIARTAAISLSQSSAYGPITQSLLIQCGKIYNDALSAVGLTRPDLDRRLYRDLRLHAGMASDAAQRCQDLFKRPLQCPITPQNRKFKNLCEILGVAADLLNSETGGKPGN